MPLVVKYDHMYVILVYTHIGVYSCILVETAVAVAASMTCILSMEAQVVLAQAHQGVFP